MQCVVQALKLLHGDNAVLPTLRAAAEHYHAQQAAPIDELSQLLAHVSLAAEQVSHYNCVGWAFLITSMPGDLSGELCAGVLLKQDAAAQQQRQQVQQQPHGGQAGMHWAPSSNDDQAQPTGQQFNQAAGSSRPILEVSCLYACSLLMLLCTEPHLSIDLPACVTAGNWEGQLHRGSHGRWFQLHMPKLWRGAAHAAAAGSLGTLVPRCAATERQLGSR